MKGIIHPIPIEYWKLFGQKYDRLDQEDIKRQHSLKH